MTATTFIKIEMAQLPFTIYHYFPVSTCADYFCALTKKSYMTSEEIVMLSKANVEIEITAEL